MNFITQNMETVGVCCTSNICVTMSPSASVTLSYLVMRLLTDVQNNTNESVSYVPSCFYFHALLFIFKKE